MQNKSKCVLLLGGTGAMGEHLAHILAKEDWNVFVTSRKSRKNEVNITYIHGNAHDLHFINPLLERHFDIIVDFMVYNTEEFKQRYMILLDACKQYVYLSSSRVYADSPIITEKSPRLLDNCTIDKYLETDEYALTKARQENLLTSSGKTNYTIIRPYITFSEIRLQLGVMEKEAWLWRALHGRTIVFSRDIAEKFTTLTYGFNVSEGIAAIIGKEDALGEAFHITGTQSYQWDDLLHTYLDILQEKTGKRPKVYYTDECINLHNPKAQWQVRVDRHYNRRFDSSKIARFVDINHFLPTKEGLTKCLNEFLKHPQFNGIHTRHEALKDRMTGEFAHPSDFPNLKSWAKYIIFRLIYPEKKLY